MAFTKGNTVGFKKGRSGNPGGRARMPVDMRELVKANTAEAVAVLLEVMKNKKAPDSARVNAANSILDRGWGRPTQSVEADVTTGLSPDLLKVLRKDFWGFSAKREGCAE